MRRTSNLRKVYKYDHPIFGVVWYYRKEEKRSGFFIDFKRLTKDANKGFGKLIATDELISASEFLFEYVAGEFPEELLL